MGNMEEKDQILETNQDNDGIREYDNPLPGWFLYLFYGCVLFAGLYYPYYLGYGAALAEAGGRGQSLSASGGGFPAAVRIKEKGPKGRPGAGMSEEGFLALLKGPAPLPGGGGGFKAH